jgi:hypothetical protein
MKNAVALLALASCFTALCRAADPAPVPENLLACGKLQDPGERVRCYDTQIAAMKSSAGSPSATNSTVAPTSAAPATPAAAPAPAAAAPATAAPRSAPASAPPARERPSAAGRFGEEFLPLSSRPAPSQEEIALLSNITAMTEVAPKTYMISLSNGQVWREEEISQVTAFFHIGDDVRIEKGTLGSYHMSTRSAGSKNWVRVTRVQ